MQVAISGKMLVNEYGILEELFDEVDMGHDHAATAISFASKCVHGITASS